MSLPLELHCIVLGDNSSRAFTIEIENDKRLGTLKESIKDKNTPTFDHIPAHTLEVFKVSFPEDDDLDARLKRFRPEHDPQNGVYHLSKPMKRLHGVFGDPTDDHLHVIVVLPLAGE